MAPTTVDDIPDHLLHRVLRLLDSHDSVVRAAAVCTRWRRIASTRGLDMCWYRNDFATCLGHYHVVNPSFSPASPRKKPATAQRRRRVVFVPASPSLVTRHVSLDFLPRGPGGRPWELVDGCGSLLLLANQRRDFFPDLVVCEPISRRYVRIQPVAGMKYSRCLGAFLGYRYNVISMSSFKVACVLYDAAEGMEGGVSAVTARVYNHRAPPVPVDSRRRNGWDMSRQACSCIHLRGAESARYAGRYWHTNFWEIEDDGTVLSHSHHDYTSEFKHFHLPEHVRGPTQQGSTFRFAEGSRGMLVVSVVGDELRVHANVTNNDGTSEWVHERSLRLPEATGRLPGHKDCYFSRGTAKIVTAGKGYVVLTPAEETWVFSVDLRTMEVEREHVRNRLPGEVYPYELRTRPKVHACLAPCKRGRYGICRDFCKCR